MLQKTLIAILIPAALFFCGNSLARENGGVLYYTEIEEEIYFLLADHQGVNPGHSQRGWAGFGGGGRGQDTAETVAKREGNEELNCLFSESEMAALFKDAPSHRRGSFTTFFVRLGYIDASVLNSRSNPTDCHGGGERGPYAWIALETLKRDMLDAVLHEDDYQVTIKRNGSEQIFPQNSNDIYFSSFIASYLAAMREMPDFPFPAFDIDDNPSLKKIRRLR